ncbi:MAG: hypothetical protein AAB356_07625, partial [Deltaproteobacteria bacterium]
KKNIENKKATYRLLGLLGALAGVLYVFVGATTVFGLSSIMLSAIAAIAVGALGGLAAPWLVTVVMNFFFGGIWRKVKLVEFIKATPLDSSKVKFFVEQANQEYKEAKWYEREAYALKDAWLSLSLLFPVATGIVEFMLSRALIALAGFAVAVPLLSFLPAEWLGGSLIAGWAPEVVVSILKGLHLSHTGTELARLVIIVVALSLVGRKIRQRVYALQNLSVERRFGLPTQMKDEGGITVEVGNNAAGLIYLLKHTTDENELKQIKDRIRAMIRAGILNTRGRRALARLLEREVGSVERAPWLARQWNHTIHYFVLQSTAVAINLVSPLLTVLTLIHYIDYLIHNRRVRFDNPHYQMLVSAGKDFFKSFVGMWFISAEIGLVVDAGTAAGG